MKKIKNKTQTKSSKPKRVSIPKKLRFEVLKRDSFTCQYCGRKAPEVILHIDHILPVSKGGKNSPLNLVTSCIDCNLGKGATKISDETAVQKNRKQSELLQARREQIEMIAKWHLELAEQDNLELEAVNELYKRLTNGEYKLSPTGKEKVKKQLKVFGLNVVLQALSEATATYKNSCAAIDKLGGVCACIKDPVLKERVALLNMMHKRFFNFKRWEANAILKEGYASGGSDFMKSAKKLTDEVTGSWYRVKGSFESLVKSWETF